jgi:hypothetical protein
MPQAQNCNAQIAFTCDDWTEIYYALTDKVEWIRSNPGHRSERADTADWIKHLRRIIDKIGPDGVAAYINGVAPNSDD